jgi:hypothetical protein
MGKEEVQFADPEWQPPGQLSSTLEQEQLHPQTVNIHREQHQTSSGSSYEKKKKLTILPDIKHANNNNMHPLHGKNCVNMRDGG